ncbi:MAG: hypothetical protein ACI4ML_07915, partial [Aristaeellaceae bacterium]
CAGAGAALAPAQVWAAAQRNGKDKKKGKEKARVSKQAPKAARDGNGRKAYSHGTAPANGSIGRRRERPHPTSLRSATFLRRGRLRLS